MGDLTLFSSLGGHVGVGKGKRVCRRRGSRARIDLILVFLLEPKRQEDGEDGGMLLG